jgi:hypothetical protein
MSSYVQIRISLYEVHGLIRQAKSRCEMNESRNEKDRKFLATLDHFKDKDTFFLSRAQLKYLCDLAETDYRKYVFLEIAP